jgi:hypothetical protein
LIFKKEVIKIRTISIKGQPYCECISESDSDDFINLIDTYLGDDARKYLKELLIEYISQIEELTNQIDNMYDKDDAEDMADSQADDAVYNFKEKLKVHIKEVGIEDILDFIEDY